MPFAVISDLRVLVFDESADARSAMLEHLRDLGVSRLRETGDPLEALEIIRSGPIDMIVTEWNLQLVNLARRAAPIGIGPAHRHGQHPSPGIGHSRGDGCRHQ